MKVKVWTDLVINGTKNIYFEKSPGYRLIREDANNLFFVYRTGKRILTDELGQLIWQALPGNFNEIKERINGQKCVSFSLLKVYLLVLAKAGLILLRDEKGKAILPGRARRSENVGEKLEERGEERREKNIGEARERRGRENIAGVIVEEVDGGEGREGGMRGPKEGSEEGEGSEKDGGECEPNPLISVIIVTYNGEDYITRCLHSVFRQTYRPLEVIVVDNASTDATIDLIRRDFPRCRLIKLKRNRHYAGGLNRGLKEANGEYFLFLNQDVFLEPNCLTALYNRLAKEPQAGLAAPMIKFASLPGFINGLGNQINNRGWGTDNFIYCVDIGQFRELKELPSACFGAAFLRREAIERVGPLDEGYGSFYEDVDWSFRCWFQGMKIVPVPEAVVYHEFGGSYPHGKKLFFVVRNRLRLVVKLFQGRIRLGFLKNYLIEDGRNCLSFLRKKEFKPFFCYLGAYFSFMWQLPSIQVKRWRVMKKKLKNIRERDILIKNPSFYCCLNPVLALPEVDVAVIRRYYLWPYMGAQGN